MAQNYTEPFEVGNYYHLFNRAVGNEKLYYRERNYHYFLTLYQKFLNHLMDTYSYCWLPNHFHFLVRIKEEAQNGGKISEAFRRFFISYSQAINKQERRKGSLFMRPFKRKEIKNDEYLSAVIYYIHYNPTLHGINQDYQNYEWSSYAILSSDTPSWIAQEEVWQWFGGKDGFKKDHQFSKSANWMIE